MSNFRKNPVPVAIPYGMATDANNVPGGPNGAYGGSLITSTSGAPNAPEAMPQNLIIKRTLLVNITGSPANLALAGPQAAMWKPVAGRETEVFSQHLGADITDQAEAVNAIRAGLVRSVTIKEHRSTYPFILGVSLSCVPPSEVTDLGEKYAYTVLPHSQIASPQKVYECNDNMHHGLAWRMQYPEYNHANLETHGVMDCVGQPTVFLHEHHPAVGLLRHNQDMIGCEVDALPRMGDGWLNISRQVLKLCCQTLRAKVLSKFQNQDMNMFSLQLHRLNAEAWDDFGDDALASFKPKAKWTPDELDSQKQHHLRQFVTTPYSYVARLEVEFEVPATSPSTTLR